MLYEVKNVFVYMRSNQAYSIRPCTNVTHVMHSQGVCSTLSWLTGTGEPARV